jgi:hypothetical protein
MPLSWRNDDSTGAFPRVSRGLLNLARAGQAFQSCLFQARSRI